MRRFFALVLVIVCTLGMTACNANTATNNANTTSSNDTQSIQNVPSQDEITLAEAVIVNQNDIKLTVTGFKTDEDGNVIIPVLIENNSQEELTFTVISSSVNGYMIDCYLNADVSANKKANTEMEFYAEDLELCGVSSVADIEFVLDIFTDELKSYLTTDKISLKTSIADKYTYTYDDSGDVLYNANGIKIVSKGFVPENSYYAPALALYIENTNDYAITAESADVSINGYMVNSWLYAEITEHRRTVDILTIYNKDLEDNNIENIEELEFHIEFWRTDNGDSIAETEIFTIPYNK